MECHLTEIAHPGSEDRGREVADLFERANAAYDSGEFLTAVMLLDEVLSKGVDVVALNNKGAALDAMNRRTSAEECYLAAIGASPEYELAWHNLANTLAAQEKHREAAKSYARAGKLNPGRIANTVGLVESYIGMGRMRRARTTVASLDSLAERDPSVRLTQADLYALTGAWDDAVRACERFIATDPADLRGLSRLGGVLHDSGRYADAVSAYEKALAVSPRDPQIRNDYGYACFCAGDINRALAAFDRAIDLDPHYKHAWYNKGYALHSVDRLEEAVDCYRKAVQIDSRDRVLLNNLGNALYNLGRYAESIPMFVRAIGVDPDYEIAWNNIGNALEKMGRYAEAIPFHDRSLEIDPDFDYALYAKGVCKAAVGEPDEGYDLILESLDRNPDYDEAWKARSRVARQLGRMDDALASIERALAVNPNFCEGWMDLGDMLLDTGDGSGADRSYLRALKCIDGAIERDVSDGASWTRRARILLRLGRHDESLESALHAMVVRHPSPS